MKKRIASLAALIVLTVLLSGCWQGVVGSKTSIDSATQAMGDQDITFGGHTVTVAGQLGDWQGHGKSIWVYTITLDSNCAINDTYVVPAAPFVITAVCNNGTWVIAGTTDSGGKITAATPTEWKKGK